MPEELTACDISNSGSVKQGKMTFGLCLSDLWSPTSKNNNKKTKIKLKTLFAKITRK